MAVDPIIWVAAISTAGTLVVAYLRRQDRKRLDEVHYQVKNSHRTNLREDIDELLLGYRRLLKELRRERLARRALAERVRRIEEDR